MKADIHFDGEGHKRPPEDYPADAKFKVRQQSIFIDGVKVTARNEDGWLRIAVETTDAVKGWALSYNGREFPTTDDALRTQSASLAAVLHRISLTPCYHDMDTPNERLLDEDEPCPACIATEALEKAQ